MNIGRNDSIGPDRSIPSRLSPQPHWKIVTRTSSEAEIADRFMIAALIGTATERKAAVSSTNAKPITTAKNGASRDSTRSVISLKVAVAPATNTSGDPCNHPMMPGTVSARSRCTRAAPGRRIPRQGLDRSRLRRGWHCLFHVDLLGVQQCRVAEHRAGIFAGMGNRELVHSHPHPLAALPDHV